MAERSACSSRVRRTRMPRPADGIEITAIDEAAQRRHAACAVVIDVIEHHAGVVAMSPAKADAAAQPSRSLHQPAHGRKAQTARPAQAVVLVMREAAPVGVE